MSQIADWPTWEELGWTADFKCFTCEDTGEVWGPDPMFPQYRQCDILIKCSCSEKI